METLPILDGLTNEQFDSILEICTRRILDKNAIVYKEGDASRDMYILTEGVLLVSLWGKEIGRVFPVSPVGEMGLFTGERRSADVTALTNCTLLQIKDEDLFALLDKDKNLHIRFLEGMLKDMSTKLRLANELIAKQRAKLDRGR